MLKENGFSLVIASTTKKNNMEVYRTLNKKIIDKANIDDNFTAVYTREDVSEMKPHPEMYLKVMNDLEVSAEDCLIFEDSLVGAEAAKASGAEVAVIYDKYSDGERSKINLLADYRIQTYSEAISMLKSIL